MAGVAAATESVSAPSCWGVSLTFRRSRFGTGPFLRSIPKPGCCLRPPLPSGQAG